jgi:pimeloyl-ACP methyl ester carboxylesterase
MKPQKRIKAADFFACCFCLLLTHSGALTAQVTPGETNLVLETSTGKIYGTLQLPEKHQKMPLVLIIAGSGPTDRDGNSAILKGKNNSLKKLASGLASRGIASLRYDKRGIGESKASMSSESKMRFDEYVSDARGWIELLKKDARFSSVTVAGHSEGSLIGMIAARDHADKYISIAGAGEPADEILKTQLKNLPENSRQQVYLMLDTLKQGDTLRKNDPSFYMLFRPSIQPYMISWMKYDPVKEIGKLQIPVLIIQGTNDIQVSAEDAKRLSSGLPIARLLLIEQMNHILCIVGSSDKQANIDSYSNPELPLAPTLIDSISSFVLDK